MAFNQVPRQCSSIESQQYIVVEKATVELCTSYTTVLLRLQYGRLFPNLRFFLFVPQNSDDYKHKLNAIECLRQ